MATFGTGIIRPTWKERAHRETWLHRTIRTYLGQNRRDRAAWDADVSSTSMKRRSDVAGRTRGSDQTNHRPMSSRHSVSLHPPPPPAPPPIPYSFSSCVLHLLQIISSWVLRAPPSVVVAPFPTLSFLQVSSLLTDACRVQVKIQLFPKCTFLLLHALHKKNSSDL